MAEDTPTAETPASLPLAGLSCCDYGVWHAGPAVTSMLADMGADVIKIENLHGDPTRRFSRYHGVSVRLERADSYQMNLSNRGKSSISIDIHSDEGREITQRIIAQSDVFVTNLRKEYLHQWALDWETLHANHAGLVYAHVSGFGPRGSEKNQRAFDTLAVARSGLLSVFNPNELEPFLFGLGDQMAGVAGTMGVLAALYRRAQTGVGELVETSLLGGLLHLMAMPLHVQLGLNTEIKPQARDDVFNPLITWYKASDDRWIMFSENMPDAKWGEFCIGLGREDWIADERYIDLRARGQNARGLIAEIDKIVAQRTADEWLEIFSRLDMAVTVVQSLMDMGRDPQALANGYVAQQGYPDEPFLRKGTGFPVSFGGTVREVFSRGPGLGEQSGDILRRCGYGESEIEDLVDRGVVIQTEPLESEFSRPGGQ
jgi:crotonobetainyl-CoA:carnitine CoA-transferase CaiB-like acyl-CoA transferase